MGSHGLGSWEGGIVEGWDWRWIVGITGVGIMEGWDWRRVGLKDCWDHWGWDHGRVGLEMGGIGEGFLGSWKGGIAEVWDHGWRAALWGDGGRGVGGV